VAQYTGFAALRIVTALRCYLLPFSILSDPTSLLSPISKSLPHPA
jgi:hypothetical protein